MSTILKALRRLEEERSRVDPRDLREEVTASGRPRVRGRRRLRWIAPVGALAAGVVLGLVSFWVVSPFTPEGSPAEREPGRAALGAAGPAVAAAPAGRAAVGRERREIARVEPPAAIAPAERVEIEPAPPERAEAARAPVLQPVELPVAEAPPTPAAPGGAVEVAARAPEPPALPAPVAPARELEPAPPRVAPVEETPPARRAVPAPAVATARQALPAFTVASTRWHPDPSRRVAEVALAGRPEPLKLREGDAVGPLVVREIEPDAVVFVNGEVETRRLVGSR